MCSSWLSTLHFFMSFFLPYTFCTCWLFLAVFSCSTIFQALFPAHYFHLSSLSLVMATITSPKIIQSIVDRYTDEVNELNIPDLLDPSIDSIQTSPFTNKLVLNKIANDLTILLRDISKYKSNKNYAKLHTELNDLIIRTNEKSFVNEVNLKNFIATNSPVETQKVEQVHESQPVPELEEDEENLSQLRSRLLSSNSYSNLNKPVDNQNAYHESFQEELLSDLTDLASTLKSSALSFSSKILDDTNILSKTSENLHLNNNLMNLVGDNLNNYISNKTGGKIGFWFILKVMISVFLLFIVMILLIKVLPKM